VLQCPWPRDQSDSPPPSKLENSSDDGSDNSYRTALEGEEVNDVAKKQVAIPPSRRFTVVILTS
jgi:hypothetical protein